MSGFLYIVATPIGNLEDITLRALKVLKEVDLIAAEDTRHTRKLLSHFGISKPLVSYWGAREKVKAEKVISSLLNDKDVALVTDAGTPGISDPGEVLIRRAIEENITVVPVPGPSAIITALSVSGLSTREFLFLGFLAPKSSQRRKRLQEVRFEDRTMVIYESPHRLIEVLGDMHDILGDRYAAVSHELTKFNESVYRGRIADILDELKQAVIAGEYVIVLEGMAEAEISIDDALQEVIGLMKKGLKRKDAVKKVAGQYGLRPKELYDRTLDG